jgi:hypothetical protein
MTSCTYTFFVSMGAAGIATAVVTNAARDCLRRASLAARRLMILGVREAVLMQCVFMTSSVACVMLNGVV